MKRYLSIICMLFLMNAIHAQDEDMGFSRSYDTDGFARFKVENLDTTGTVGITFVIGEDSIVIEISNADAKLASSGPLSINTTSDLLLKADQLGEGALGLNSSGVLINQPPADTVAYDTISTDGMETNRLTTGRIRLSNDTAYTGTLISTNGNVSVDSTICHPWQCKDDTTFTLSHAWIGTASPPIASKLYAMGNVGFIDLSTSGDTSYSFLFSAKDGLYQFEVNDDVLSQTSTVSLLNGGFNVNTISVQLGDYDLVRNGTFIRVDDDAQVLTMVSGNGFALGDDEGLNHGVVLYQDNTGQLTYNGKIKVTDGTEANGYVFTSDATGLGSWAPTRSYDTTEVLTGEVWFDGSPIYQRVFYVPDPSILAAASYDTIPGTAIADIAGIVDIDVVSELINGGQHRYYSPSFFVADYDVNNNVIGVQDFAAAWQMRDHDYLIITAKYTKNP